MYLNDKILTAFDDLYFNIQVALACKRMTVGNARLYHFRKRISGITGSTTRQVSALESKQFVVDYIQGLAEKKLCNADAANLRTADILLLSLINISYSYNYNDYYRSHENFLHCNANHLLRLKKGLDIRSKILLSMFLMPTKLSKKIVAKLLYKIQLLQNRRKYD